MVIDLVCYRRLGHNEADDEHDPAVMYSIIRSLPTTRAKYAARLVEAGVVSIEGANGLVEAYRTKLSNGGITCCNSQTRSGLPRIADPLESLCWQPWRQAIDATHGGTHPGYQRALAQQYPGRFRGASACP